MGGAFRANQASGGLRKWSRTFLSCNIQAGAFRIGDTAGTLENIVSCKLYRPGSVGFVSKSGGLSNECYNVLSRVTDGLYEGMRVLAGLHTTALHEATAALVVRNLHSIHWSLHLAEKRLCP